MHAAAINASRTDREAARGKQGPHAGNPAADRTRSAAVTDPEAFGEHQIKLTAMSYRRMRTRTAAITGVWVALCIATEKMLLAGITRQPIRENVAAISCGVWQDLRCRS